MTAHDCQWTLAPEMLDQARLVIDRAMANTEIPETPELHGFSRWALQEARRLRGPERCDCGAPEPCFAPRFGGQHVPPEAWAGR